MSALLVPGLLGVTAGAATALDGPQPAPAGPTVTRGEQARLLASRAARNGKTFAAPTTAGQSGDNAQVAGTKRSVFVSRASTRPGDLTDGAGNRWSRMPLTFGTASRTAVSGVTAPTAAEADVYSYVALNPTGYQLEVPKGRYSVRLLFTEPSKKAGERVFDVTAEGKTVVNGLDVAKAAGGAAKGHQVTFDVNVHDGTLDLRFVPRKGVPIVSGVEVISTGKVAVQDRSSERAVRLSPTSPFYQRIDKAPLAVNSAALVQNLSDQVRNHWGGIAATNAYEFNTSFYEAAPNTPRVTVGFHNCQNKPRTPKGLYDGPKYFVDVPIPPEALPAKGTDGQMTVYDPAADQLWEFWVMRKDTAGKWEACWGGRIDDVSTNIGQFPFPYGVSASGLVTSAGMITIDEARRGEINHVMNLALLQVRSWEHVSWPANRSDGSSQNPNTFMEGQRLRLDPTLDLDQYNLTPFARMVAEAAQTYGFIVKDRSGAVAVATQDGRLEQARTGTNPWRTLLGTEPYLAMKNFPWDKMQALPKDYGKP